MVASGQRYGKHFNWLLAVCTHMGPMNFPIASFVTDVVLWHNWRSRRSKAMQIELPLWYKRGNLWKCWNNWIFLRIGSSVKIVSQLHPAHTANIWFLFEISLTISFGLFTFECVQSNIFFNWESNTINAY